MSAPQVVTVSIPGTPDRYYSTQGFISNAADDPASTPFHPRITGVIAYDRVVGCSVWGNSTTAATIGAIQLENADGELDVLLSEDWRDRTLTAKRGLATEALSAHDYIFDAVIDRVTTPDFYSVQFSLRDKGALLDIPLQSETYVLAGFIFTVPELEGTHKPVCIGNCRGAPLTLVNALLLDYDVADEEVLAIDEVTDRGVILSNPAQWAESPEAGVYGVRRYTNPGPGAKQVAQVRGAMEGSVLIERLPDVLSYLLDRSGGRVYSDEQDPYTADALDALAPYTLCYWGRDATTIASVLTQVMDSFTGWWYFDRLGNLRVGRLQDPAEISEDPVLELNEINLIGDVTLRLDTAPGLSDSVAGERNWSPFGKGEIAGRVSTLEPDRANLISTEYLVRKGVNTLHPTYSHAVGAPPIKTLLSDADHAQDEADRLTALYSVERYFYDCAVALESDLAFTLEPGMEVMLTLDRYGLDAGKPLLVVGVRTNLLSSVVELTLWGAGPQPGDF